MTLVFSPEVYQKSASMDEHSGGDVDGLVRQYMTNASAHRSLAPAAGCTAGGRRSFPRAAKRRSAPQASAGSQHGWGRGAEESRSVNRHQSGRVHKHRPQCDHAQPAAEGP
eukprot:scaffold73939_cov26-Tisochrysis_lutea.AAC.3